MEFEKAGHEITFGIVNDPSGILDQIGFEFLDHITPLKLDLFGDVAAGGTGGDIRFGMRKLKCTAFNDEIKHGTGEAFFQILFGKYIFGKRIDKVSDRMIGYPYDT